METKKNIIIIGVNPFNGNRGVGALAYSTIYLLNKLSKESNIDLEINLVNVEGKKVVNKSIIIDQEEIDITFFPFLIGSGLKGFLKIMFSLLLSRKVINKTRYILDMGEGDSFSDIYGKGRFFSINFPKKIFRFFGKKQALLPQTIGPFKDSLIKKKAIKSIEKSSVVMARDNMSYNYVKENTSQRNVIEIIDVAFYMPYQKRVFNNGKINIGLNISSLMWHGGYTRNNQFGFNFDYQDMMKKVIDYFLSLPDIQLHLIPHVVLLNSNIENDYEVSKHLYDVYNTDKLTLAPFFLDPIDAKNYISGLDFFTGARMHACIAAFSSGVPVYPIAYSRKFNGLFGDTLEYPHIGDLINQLPDDFLGGLKYAFENKEELAQKIGLSMDKIVKPRYDILMSELKQFLDINADE